MHDDNTDTEVEPAADTEVDETAEAVADEPTDAGEPAEAGEEPEPDSFPRAYVEKLRQENGNYRQRAGKADAYAQRLHTEMVRATGRLADPTDLPFDEAHIDDPQALAAAVDDLLSVKPHLATRRPVGDIGQGASAGRSTVDLAAILRQRA